MRLETFFVCLKSTYDFMSFVSDTILRFMRFFFCCYYVWCFMNKLSSNELNWVNDDKKNAYNEFLYFFLYMVVKKIK